MVRRAVAKDGGSSRRAAVEKSVASVGGRLESFYFAFGGSDAFVIVDLPDNVSAAAMALAVDQSGMAIDEDGRAVDDRGNGRGDQEDRLVSPAGRLTAGTEGGGGR